MLWLIDKDKVALSSVLLALVILTLSCSCTDPEGGLGGGLDPPLSNYKNIEGFLNNVGPDPLKTLKDSPAKHHLNGVSLAGR